ncbi:HigA family addiction module antitoxin [Stappia sp.]|uniref:HigA family addiction module antitoxin n=1 Tax=Stappia sp. TaxID=1870903 RepID=UPI003C7EB582
MTVHVPAFHPGEILAELYLEPLGMSAGKLAKALGLPRTRIERLVKGETDMTVDTAAHLARAFSTTVQYWINLQSAYDIREFETSATNQAKLDAIEPIDLSGGEKAVPARLTA